MNGTEQRTVGQTIGAISTTTAVACGGCGIAIIGSLGPWATGPLSSASGTNGDGVIPLILAAIGLILIAAGGMRSTGAATFAGMIGVALLGFGVYEILHINQRLSGIRLFGQQVDHVGWGVYAVAVGGALTVLTALRVLLSPRP